MKRICQIKKSPTVHSLAKGLRYPSSEAGLYPSYRHSKAKIKASGLGKHDCFLQLTTIPKRKLPFAKTELTAGFCKHWSMTPSICLLTKCNDFSG